MNTILTDQETVDRWLETGRWEQFAEGETITLYDSGPFAGRTESLPPADWDAEGNNAPPCETCDGMGEWKPPMTTIIHLCPDCGGSGVQRSDGIKIPVQVPCLPHQRGRGCLCELVTVAYAVQTWGPYLVVSQADEPRPIQGAFDHSFLTLRYHNDRPFLVRFVAGQRGEGDVLDLPPGIDPASLIGQWARGGTIEPSGVSK